MFKQKLYDISVIPGVDPLVVTEKGVKYAIKFHNYWARKKFFAIMRGRKKYEDWKYHEQMVREYRKLKPIER